VVSSKAEKIILYIFIIKKFMWSGFFPATSS
jgi:hypothetical protein